MSRNSQGPNPINVIVGRRLRLKREMASLSQSALGVEIDVSRIKIGQYESGQIPVPASKLFLLARFFKVGIEYFFNSDEQSAAMNELEELDPLLNRLSISLLRDFDRLEHPEVRKSFAAVMERAAVLLRRQHNHTEET